MRRRARLLGLLVVAAALASQLSRFFKSGEEDSLDEILGLSYDRSLDPASCRPRTKVAFLKTHKTASSTVQNVLLRYGLAHGLNFALPPERDGHFFKGSPDVPFRVEWMSSLAWHDHFLEHGLYDVFAVHATWNRTALEILLGPDPLVMTILRDPTASFESAYVYFNVQRKNGLSLKQFIAKLDRGEVSPLWPYTTNRLSNMAWDLGIANRDFFNRSALEAKVAELDREVDLVMIAELLDESLVLMAHELCVPLFRMATVDKNARTEKHRVALTEREVAALRRAQFADERLYRHFRKKLERRIREFGVERMEASVGELRSLRSQLRSACGLSTGRNSRLWSDPSSKFREWSRLVSANSASRTDVEECLLVAYTEEHVVRHIRDRQRQRYVQYMQSEGEEAAAGG